ncbi:hypothetical protein A7X67_04175 [Clostridium sp. W14A]|nr:hypothetical protein A7X67_04175 [Clostridium sp. W14A]
MFKHYYFLLRRLKSNATVSMAEKTADKHIRRSRPSRKPRKIVFKNYPVVRPNPQIPAHTEAAGQCW